MNESGSQQLDLKKYWHLILARKYVFIAVSLIIMSVIVWGSYFMPEIYEAECTVFIERNIIKNLVKNIAITPSLEDRLSVLTYAMKSRKLLLKVIDDLDVPVDPDSGKTLDKEELVKEFQRKTRINMVRRGPGGTDLFLVSYRHKNPRFARDYVNALVRRYVEENLTDKREESYEANKFLAEQSDFFKKKLSKAEEKIANFRRDKGIFVAVDERAIVAEIKRAQEQLEQLDVMRTELEAKKRQTEKQLKEEKPYTVAMLGRMTGQTRKERIAMLESRLSELLLNYTEKYPEVIRIKAEIETLKKQAQDSPEDEKSAGRNDTEMSTINPIYQKLKEELGKIELELVALSAKEKQLKKLIDTKKAYLRDIPIEKKKLAELERERATYQRIEEELVLKLGQTEVAKQMELQDKTETFRIVDPAIMPRKPVSPDRVKLIILGLVVGFAGGFGTIFLLDSIDNSIKTVDNLKTSFTLPVLAVIPEIVREEDIVRKRRKDRIVYGGSIAYLSVIGLLFVKEFLSR